VVEAYCDVIVGAAITIGIVISITTRTSLIVLIYLVRRILVR